jgi:integrase
LFDQCGRVTGGKASPHGWRSTFGTWCDQHGIDTIVSELCLAHTKEALAKAYKRGDFLDRRRAAMQDWANWLSEPATADVIPLRRA